MFMPFLSLTDTESRGPTGSANSRRCGARWRGCHGRGRLERAPYSSSAWRLGSRAQSHARSSELGGGPSDSSSRFLGFGEVEKEGKQQGLVAHLTSKDMGGKSAAR